MAIALHVDPYLEALIIRARAEAEQAGDLPAGPPDLGEWQLPADVAAVVQDWLKSGDYEQVVAEIGATDPDLANG
ncbi:MAG TPA: hypothetical protein VGM93_12700 [Acidimicrobiales bacterium]